MFPVRFSSALRSAIHQKKILIAAGATLATIGLLLAARPLASAAPTAQPAVAAMTITSVRPSTANWPVSIETSGAIYPWQEAVVTPQASGLKLIAIHAGVGDQVKRGQLLASYDTALLQADFDRLKASMQQAEANWQRARQLQGSGSISAQDTLQYQTQAAVARAQLKTTQLQLDYARVSAPDDGVISASSATLGSLSSSTQELFRIIRKSRLEWRGELSAEQLPAVKPGMKATIVLSGSPPVSVTVRQLAPALDNKTRMGLVYVDLPRSAQLHAGSYLSGSIQLGHRPALILPAASILLRDGHSYVFRLQPDNRVRQQAVQTGRRQDDYVEVLSGVQPSDRMVLKGAAFLNDGDLVQLAATTKD
jgi:RND family efflux transporter MFP subunit